MEGKGEIFFEMCIFLFRPVGVGCRWGLEMLMVWALLVPRFSDRRVLDDEAREEEGLFIPTGHGRCRSEPRAEKAISWLGGRR